MLSKSRLILGLLLAVMALLFMPGEVKAGTPTPTPWNIATWGVTGTPYPMCTLTPGPTVTSFMPTIPPFVACPPCGNDGKDQCGNTCFAPTWTPEPTNTATPFNPLNLIDAYAMNGSEIITDNNYYIKVISRVDGTDGLDVRWFTTDNAKGNMKMWVKIKPNDLYSEPMLDSYNGSQANNLSGLLHLSRWGFSEMVNNHSWFYYSGCGTNCVSHHNLPAYQTQFNISEQPGGSMYTLNISVEPGTYSYRIWRVMVEVWINADPEGTPTPTSTLTATPGNCIKGIPTPGGGGGDPITWINPPQIITGSCYTIIPQISFPIPGLVTAIVNPILPEGWSLPASVGNEGYELCVDWLQINMSFMGVQYDGLLGVAAWLFVAGLVYKEIAS